MSPGKLLHKRNFLRTQMLTNKREHWLSVFVAALAVFKFPNRNLVDLTFDYFSLSVEILQPG